MKYGESKRQLKTLRGRIATIRDEIRKVQKNLEPEDVEDHGFRTDDGEVRLSALFGGKAQLFVIHNMGSSCAYCTLWADGYNGLYEHIANRAAFIVASPDTPAQQRKFASGRGWRFPMVSDTGSKFAYKMGYATADGGCQPGISVFQKDGKRIVRVSDALSGPYDDFCAIWHLFDMLPEGAKSWRPAFKYPVKQTA